MRFSRLLIISGIGVMLTALEVAVSIPRAHAQQDPDPSPAPITDDQVNEIANQLFCPVCENIPLDVCGTQACSDWRQEIRAMLADGKSEAEIKQYFASRYGQRVLATPEASGANLLVWVLPVVGAVIGLGVLVVALRQMAPGALAAEVSTSAVAPDYSDLEPEYVARFEREYKEFSS
jgi:cytochrome c-type biogenesis protein CcmH